MQALDYSLRRLALSQLLAYFFLAFLLALSPLVPAEVTESNRHLTFLATREVSSIAHWTSKTADWIHRTGSGRGKKDTGILGWLGKEAPFKAVLLLYLAGRGQLSPSPQHRSSAVAPADVSFVIASPWGQLTIYWLFYCMNYSCWKVVWSWPLIPVGVPFLEHSWTPNSTGTEFGAQNLKHSSSWFGGSRGGVWHLDPRDMQDLHCKHSW